MISPFDYFESYISNYYDIKLEMFSSYTSHIRSTEAPDNSSAYTTVRKKEKVLQSEIRQTYFHAIETLFEMVFALSPNDEGKIEDELMMRAITNAGQKTYKKIEKLVKPDGLAFLEQEVSQRFTEPVPLLQYIFFLGLDSRKYSELHPSATTIRESIGYIKQILKALATDFIDRNEYNSYKHGLRLISKSQTFELENTDTKSTLRFDLSDSMTYLIPNYKNPNEVEIVTKVFDTEKDLIRIGIISKLIQNIVNARKYFLGNKKEIVELPIHVISKAEKEKFFKINHQVGTVSLKSKPIE